MTVGIAHATWSGVGIILLTPVGAMAFRENPDTTVVIGMGLIVAEVIVIHMFPQPVRLAY